MYGDTVAGQIPDWSSGSGSGGRSPAVSGPLLLGRVVPSNIDERLQASKNVPGVSGINIDRRSDDRPTLASDGQRCLCVGSITQPVCLKKYHSGTVRMRLQDCFQTSTAGLNDLFAFRLGKPKPGAASEDDSLLIFSFKKTF